MALTGMLLRVVLGTLAGAGAGYLYHRLVGCRTGACLISANPYVATIYGAVLGILLSRPGR